MSYLVSNKENMQSSNNYEDNCKYHPNKKAKYKIVSVPNVYSPLSLTDTICSKCAV